MGAASNRNRYFVLLCRTTPVDGVRHNGMSQFLVPLDTPGIVRTPVKFLDGSDDFREVSYRRVHR